MLRSAASAFRTQEAESGSENRPTSLSDLSALDGFRVKPTGFEHLAVP